jgi:hypothetical protein
MPEHNLIVVPEFPQSKSDNGVEKVSGDVVDNDGNPV